MIITGNPSLSLVLGYAKQGLDEVNSDAELLKMVRLVANVDGSLAVDVQFYLLGIFYFPI